AVDPAGLLAGGVVGASGASLGAGDLVSALVGVVSEVAVVPVPVFVEPLDVMAANAVAPLRAVPKSTPVTKVWPLVMTMRPGSRVVCTQSDGTTSRTRNRPVSRPSNTVKLYVPFDLVVVSATS